MNTNFKKRLWMNVIVIVASITAVVIAIVYFSGDLDAKANTIIKSRTSAQVNTAAVSRLASLEQDEPVADAYESALTSLLPTKNDLINIPPVITKLGQDDGVTATFTFQGNPSTPPAGSAGTVPFTITAQGSFTNLGTFMKDIETNTKFIATIASFDIVNNAGGNVLTAQGTLYFH